MQIKGLTSKQVILNREKYGANIMPEPPHKTVWHFFLGIFKDKINLLLLLLTVLFSVLAMFNYGELAEAFGIGGVLVIISIVNVVTKMRSQRATLELQRQASKISCNVMRNGKVSNIDSSEIVVGDVVFLQAGDTVPADGYIVQGQIAVNNSILNGESEEVYKSVVHGFTYNPDAAISADDYTDKNQVFAGTTVMGGDGAMLVTRVGINTENAKMLHTLRHVKETKTTLQIQLDKLADSIGKLGGACAVIIAIVMLFVHWVHGEYNDWGNMLYGAISALMVGLTVFVAAVPEGLPFIIEIITFQNARKMTRAKLLAKNPHKIPEAGSIQLLCTDKTGTITYGRMMPVANYTGDGEDIGFAFNRMGTSNEFTKTIIINGRAVIEASGKIVGGNSTERALLKAINILPRQIANIKNTNPVVFNMPFDSANKFSMTSVRHNGKIRTYIMGAPEILAEHAKHYIDTDGKLRPLIYTKLHKLITNNTKKAMRSVATAYYDGNIKDGKIPKNLVFISLSVLRDDVRTGVIDVMKSLHQSGVQVMMITGDNIHTAYAIAKDAYIITDDDDIAMTAKDFESLPNAQARKILPKIRIIARATPQTKLRIIQLAQQIGLCIGMCGDGTNDAPALKAADVGFAMGDSTDVCKSASDIIILDNNFVSIGNSILMGRTFMHNIVSFLRFQLPVNFMLVGICVLFPVFLGIDGLAPVQILIINIVMDSLNSLAFGGEAPRKEYMSEPVMGKKAPLISWATKKFILYVTVVGLFIFALTTTVQIQNIFNTPAVYTSALFALLVIMAILNGFCVRAPKYNIFAKFKNNPMFLFVAAIVFIGTYVCVTYGGDALHLTPLSPLQWAIVVGLALLIIPLDMLYRAICTHNHSC